MNNDMIIKEILALREDVDYIKEIMATKQDIALLLEGQDYIISFLKRLETEMASMKHAIMRHEKMLTAH